MAERSILITGATGTLGKKVIEKILKCEAPRYFIHGISRDEQKQRQMPEHDNLLLSLADVRDKESLFDTCAFKYDFIFHFAALKCVDTLEDNVSEAIRTNVIGTLNVLHLARKTNARVILASTDKAVLPVNAYGMSKGLAERLVLTESLQHVVCRYGNVIGSRGSFVESLKSQIASGVVEVTDKDMTRFWMTIDEAADFIINHGIGSSGGLFIPLGLKSSKVTDFIDEYNKILCERNSTTHFPVEKRFVGRRVGEKIHESLANEFEYPTRINSDDRDRLMVGEDLKQFLAERI